jgi:glycosyltransferase involved in cell wall biosynthesis
LWEQVALPVQLRARHLDILHGLVNVQPVIPRLPSIVTIHDLAFLRHPERFRPARVAYLRSAVRLSARKAKSIIAVSKNTREDVIELFKVPEDRVSVIYPAADVSFTALPRDQVADFRRKRLDGRPYVLYVGTLEPRKNLDVLIRAFANVRLSHDLPHVLALVGSRGWMYDSLFALVRELGLSDVVRFEGYSTPLELPLWYNGAELFAYPSAYEGFGLPVLEAMSCGTPTITTSSSSLIEVAGDACLTVEPGSQEALEQAIRELVGSSEMRNRLTTAGLERAGHFSWTRTASETVKIYERVAKA